MNLLLIQRMAGFSASFHNIGLQYIPRLHKTWPNGEYYTIRQVVQQVLAHELADVHRFWYDGRFKTLVHFW